METPSAPITNDAMKMNEIKLTRVEQMLAYIIVFTAGFVDVIAFLKWKTYVSLMSGNTTQMGIFLNEDSTKNTLNLSITAIVGFMAGIFIGTTLATWKKNKISTLSFFLIAILYSTYTFINMSHPITPILSVATLALGVGMLNTIVTVEGNMKLNTVFVTGALVNVSIYLSNWMMLDDKDAKKKSRFQAFNFLLIWALFLLGTYAGSSVLDDLGEWILMVPVVLVLICAFIMHFFCENLILPSK
ncbi:MAG: YoaK family protein [Bacilli bacterium]|uniref:YoaK family protein n=1 Tax=Algoriella sp. TaxID=1872434 RepID=UPI002FC94B59